MARSYLRAIMWQEACERIDRAERLHRRFFNPMEAAERHPSWEPPVDIFETEAGLCIVVALPGVREDQLELVATEGGLLVAGERPMPEEARRAQRIRRLELPHGRFERRIPLPPGRFEFVHKTLSDGCLHLSLRRVEG